MTTASAGAWAAAFALAQVLLVADAGAGKPKVQAAAAVDEAPHAAGALAGSGGARPATARLRETTAASRQAQPSPELSGAQKGHAKPRPRAALNHAPALPSTILRIPAVRPTPETFQDRAILCQHQAAVYRVTPGQRGVYVHTCAFGN
jgi:hypothetical protein